MRFRNVAVVAVALLVVLSGCSAFGGTGAEPSNDTETGANGMEDVEDAEDEAEDREDGEDEGTEQIDEGVEPNGTDNETDGDGGGGGDGGDTTADAEWTPPEEPNRPLEDKREDRIERVEFVDKEPAEDGEGYSNFNLEVVANTSMESVDPPEHGDVVGEPYFFVKINEDEQKIVERTGHVSMAENGTYHIEVRPAGIEEFGEGALTVEVFLMDEDKDWDDIYDAVGKDVQFNPGTGAENSSPTDGESDSNDT
ncbi:hypothetical protein [Natronobacterium haloterrestre]|nr:hypothetical protein [Halobiforma haloterrestris]